MLVSDLTTQIHFIDINATEDVDSSPLQLKGRARSETMTNHRTCHLRESPPPPMHVDPTYERTTTAFPQFLHLSGRSSRGCLAPQGCGSRPHPRRQVLSGAGAACRSAQV